MNQTIYDKTNNYFKSYPLIRMRKGQAILAAEKEIPDIFWIRQGTIRMYQISENGAEITLHVFRAPAFLPIMFYLSRPEGEYYFQAVETVIARKAPAEEVVEFLKGNPDVLFDLVSRFADAITGLLLRIDQLSTKSAYQRVASLLLYLVQKAGKPQPDGSYIIDMRLSQPDIAAWIGVARETVSHQIDKLRKNGIIASIDRKFVVLDMDQLQKIAR